MANHSLCSDIAFKARERVVVRILQQEQKTTGCVDINTTTTTDPRRVGISSRI